MRFKRFEIALICALIAAFLAGFLVDCEAEAVGLSDKLIRLHVVANSDTDADQALKLAVRDGVLAYLSGELAGVRDAGEAREIIAGRLEEIRAVGEEVAAAWGRDYTVTVSICREDFPTTQYDTFALPAGEYESLRVRIGRAEGHNWWCVVFPPVCGRSALDAGDAAALGLNGEEVSLMTRSSGKAVVRFKTVELIHQLLRLFK